ncbi:MAG TPA: DUF929 family protein [Acidothermaceae bacterium]|nr:DUF929 family protein [Acidothermaceae bacterium]
MADGRDESGPRGRKYAAKKAAADRIAAQRAAAERAARKRNLLMAGGGVLAVLLVIGGIVLAGLHTKKGTGSSDVVSASSAVTQAIAKTAALTTAQPDLSTILGPPTALTGAALKASNGLPQVLFISAEWCPNCAAIRWPLTIALSRFGTFSGLTTTYSSTTDSDPHTPTLSYRDSSYKSSYVDFDGKEQVDGANKPLQALTTAENALFQKLGGTTSDPSPGYPFIDFGGKWKQNGTPYDPSILAGMTPDQVAATMSNATTKPGAAIQASADVFTAEICSLTGGKPANVCTAAGVAAATTALAALTK